MQASQLLFGAIALVVVFLVLLGELLHIVLRPRRKRIPVRISMPAPPMHPRFFVSLFERTFILATTWLLVLLLALQPDMPFMQINGFCLLMALWWMWRKDYLK